MAASSPTSRRRCSERSHLCSRRSQYAWSGSRRADERLEARDGPQDLVLPALGAFSRGDPALEPGEPGPVLAEVVEEEARLPLERADPGSPLEFVGVEVAPGDGGPEAEPPIGARPELELADRETHLVEPPDVRLDLVAVAGLDLDLAEELRPEPAVAPEPPRRRRSARRSPRRRPWRRRGRRGRRRRSRRGCRGRIRAGRRRGSGWISLVSASTR